MRSPRNKCSRLRIFRIRERAYCRSSHVTSGDTRHMNYWPRSPPRHFAPLRKCATFAQPSPAPFIQPKQQPTHLTLLSSFSLVPFLAHPTLFSLFTIPLPLWTQYLPQLPRKRLLYYSHKCKKNFIYFA